MLKENFKITGQLTQPELSLAKRNVRLLPLWPSLHMQAMPSTPELLSLGHCTWTLLSLASTSNCINAKRWRGKCTSRVNKGWYTTCQRLSLLLVRASCYLQGSAFSPSSCLSLLWSVMITFHLWEPCVSWLNALQDTESKLWKRHSH